MCRSRSWCRRAPVGVPSPASPGPVEGGLEAFFLPGVAEVREVHVRLRVPESDAGPEASADEEVDAGDEPRTV